MSMSTRWSSEGVPIGNGDSIVFDGSGSFTADLNAGTNGSASPATITRATRFSRGGTEILGTLTFGNTLSLTGATVSFKLNGESLESDKFVPAGVNLRNTTLSLVDLGEGIQPAGLPLTLIENTSAEIIAGTFLDLRRTRRSRAG